MRRTIISVAALAIGSLTYACSYTRGPRPQVSATLSQAASQLRARTGPPSDGALFERWQER